MNILNKLTIKHLLMNKKRTIVTIIGIILSTALMVGVGTLTSSLRDLTIRETIKRSGSQHVTIYNVDKDKTKYIENNINIDKSKLQKEGYIGYAKLDKLDEYKPYLYIVNVNNDYLKELNLLTGRLPKNNTEILISKHINLNNKANINVGDKLKLDVGDRYKGNSLVLENHIYDGNETLKTRFTKEYTIVGIVSKSNKEEYSGPGYMVFTTNDKSDKYNFYIEYSKVKDVKNKTTKIKEVLNKDAKIEYNNALLVYYGSSTYGNINEYIYKTLIIILSLIAIACAVVIYNSFAISVMERKKQFGLTSSIGATKSQLRRSVFYEAFIVSIIGIPIGVLSGIGGIFVTLTIINSLITSVFGEKLMLVVYPLYIIIPVVYMIITILISSYLPAKRASKISPVEAIRLNDDIKIKGKIKSNKVIKKLFGIESDLAYKNIKRNKKKYRITIISLFISIVLFISFSTFIKVAFRVTGNIQDIPKYDIIVGFNDENKEIIDKTYNLIKEMKEVDKFEIDKNLIIYMDTTKDNFTDSGLKYIYDSKYPTLINLKEITDKEYETLKKELNIKDNKIILINKYLKTDESTKTIINTKPMKDLENIKTFKFLYDKEELKINPNPTHKKINFNYYIYLTDKVPNYIENSEFTSTSLLGLVTKSMIEDMGKEYEPSKYETNIVSKSIKIYSKEHLKVEKELEKLKVSSNDDLYLTNFAKGYEQARNLTIVIKILLYGFISLVTLIGITSVLNTINTSMALRRKDFAVLRSVGLTTKQFNEIIWFESIFFGLKSLIYGIPTGLFVTYLLNSSSSDITKGFGLIIPYKEILICIVAVFLITLITMTYASRKSKKENILEAIREENI